MSAALSLAGYTAGIVAAAVAGGLAPLASRRRGALLEQFLAASAGIMLGVLGGHLLPEAFEAGPRVAWALVAGFAFMLAVERFFVPHALHAPQEAEAHESCPPEVEHEHVRGETAGVGAFVGLALHTLVDGLALGAAVLEGGGLAGWVFSAIVVHKVPSAFALASLMLRGGAATRQVLLACAALGVAVGLGGFLLLAARAAAVFDPAAFTPWALGFSAGSFLHVVVTDLLPDLHRHGERRWRTVASFAAGLALMVALGLVFEG